MISPMVFAILQISWAHGREADVQLWPKDARTGEGEQTKTLEPVKPNPSSLLPPETDWSLIVQRISRNKVKTIQV